MFPILQFLVQWCGKRTEVRYQTDLKSTEFQSQFEEVRYNDTAYLWMTIIYAPRPRGLSSLVGKFVGCLIRWNPISLL